MTETKKPGQAADPGTAPITKLFGEAEIAARVAELAAEIAEAMPGEFVMVGLLKGSFLFMADLIRALDAEGCRPSVEFLTLSSYGHGTESSGQVRLTGEVPGEVAGREILLIDDIADTGRSLAYARELLEAKGPKGMRTCALIDKPARREVEITVDFVGFTVGDVFVVGYGVDYAGRYRHLPYIGHIG